MTTYFLEYQVESDLEEDEMAAYAAGVIEAHFDVRWLQQTRHGVTPGFARTRSLIRDRRYE